MLRRIVFVVLPLLVFVSAARGADFSTSVLHPTAVDASGVIAGSFPESGAKTVYYFAVDAKPGDLLTQLAYSGRPEASKSIDLALLDANAKATERYWLQGSEPSATKTRSFPIDQSGRQVLRLEVEGPPTASFRVELGGSALPAGAAKAAPAGSVLSTSVFTPTRISEGGVVSGKLPGGDTNATYYLVADVKKGELLTQISVEGREGAHKEIDFELLQPDASGGEKYWVQGSSANEEKTRAFAIDKGGSQVVKIVVSGPETGTFKVELGGTALVRNAAGSDASAMAQKPSL